MKHTILISIETEGNELKGQMADLNGVIGGNPHVLAQALSVLLERDEKLRLIFLEAMENALANNHVHSIEANKLEEKGERVD